MCCLQIFSFSQKPEDDEEEEEDDDDLSDSNDSVYSGLEDSGSDSDDDDKEEEQGSNGDDDDDDVKAESKLDEQVRLSLYLSTVVAIIFLYSITNVLHYPQGKVEERRLNKGGEEKNNDEYEHDSSDEEVR